jgi:putative ABC transport system permease protein
MAKSFWALLHVSPGFRTERTLTARLSLPRTRYPDNPRIADFQRELLQSVRSAPGVQSAGFATYLPLSGTDNGWAFFIEGRPPLPVGVFNMAKYRPASPGYFEAIGIPLQRGRAFSYADTEDAPWVVVINQSMARQYWGEQDPMGQRLHFNSERWRTVIGVVGTDGIGTLKMNRTLRRGCSEVQPFDRSFPRQAIILNKFSSGIHQDLMLIR